MPPKRKTAKAFYRSDSSGKSKPTSRSSSFNYQMLDRLKSDADYFLGNGNRYEKHLYYGDKKEHLKQMKLMYKHLPKDAKPIWLTKKDLREYKKRFMNKDYKPKNKFYNIDRFN